MAVLITHEPPSCSLSKSHLDVSSTALRHPSAGRVFIGPLQRSAFWSLKFLSISSKKENHSSHFLFSLHQFEKDLSFYCLYSPVLSKGRLSRLEILLQALHFKMQLLYNLPHAKYLNLKTFFFCEQCSNVYCNRFL